MKIKSSPSEKNGSIQISEFPDSFQDFLYMILNPSFYEFTIQNIKMQTKRSRPPSKEQAIENGMNLKVNFRKLLHIYRKKRKESRLSKKNSNCK